MSKTTHWKLTAGGAEGQETSQKKLEEGLAYIERLKADGEKIISIENDGKKLIINMED